MTPEPVRFGWRRAWLVKAVVGGAIVAGGAAAMAIAIGMYGFGDFGADRRILFAAMFVAFAILLGSMAVTYVGELVARRPIVRLDADGLEDRRISRLPIPWDAIRGMTAVQNGMQLMLALDVADPRGIPPPRNPTWRLNRWCARRMGYPEIVVRITGLDADLFTVMQAIGGQGAES